MNLRILNSVRTNNFKDAAIMQKITEMWKEASSLLENQNVATYGVYYNYESNYKGDYTVSVAIEDTYNPSITILNTSEYEVFIVDTSEETGVLNAWQKIWEREEKGQLKRAYSYDFEKYYPNGQIEIHIAIN
ncbi:GyrI-like domain-containing protein [Niallia taxi]|uniref:GyrI-like domain-containing protein n=1 Tax=Niallia taxi TaxID=2499688 RepID=UPI003D273CAC